MWRFLDYWMNYYQSELDITCDTYLVLYKSDADAETEESVSLL